MATTTTTTARITDIKCYSVANPNLGQLCLRRIVRATTTSDDYPPQHHATFSGARLGESRVSLRFDLASVLSSEERAFAYFSNKLAENFGLTFLECAPLAAAMARSALNAIRAGCGPGLLLLTQIDVVYRIGIILNATTRSPTTPRTGGLSPQIPPLQQLEAEFINGSVILNSPTRFPTTPRTGGLSPRSPLPPSQLEAEFIDGSLILNAPTRLPSRSRRERLSAPIPMHPLDLEAEFIDEDIILNAPATTFPTAEGGGLCECEISSLKSGLFTGAEEELCSICLDAFRSGSSVVTTLPPPCGHVFHNRCIAEWLRRSRTCPVSRRSVA